VSASTANEAAKRDLFIIPNRRGDGFHASVRGHILDLIDPSSYALAPTADDLFVISIASALAWSARSFLRTHGLPDSVSISAEWQANEGQPLPADIGLTVTVSKSADAASAALAAALENSLATRSFPKPVVRIALEGANR
jgi:hypothetical protein